MATYSYATLADAQNAVSARLYDNGVAGQPSFQMWPQAELTYYITEALRAWNAYTSFQKAEFTFNLKVTTPNPTNWYDITAQQGTLRPYTVTDQYLANLIEYHLLEPQTATAPLNTQTPGLVAWSGSSQFSLNDILYALTRRQNEVLTATGCNISPTTVVANLVRRTNLPDNTLEIRRVAWLPVSGFGYVPTILRQSDNWEKQSFAPNWTTQTAGYPRLWLQSNQPPLSFDVDVIPGVSGVYDILTVESGAVSSAGLSHLLSIPDDWSFVPKWGALADVLSKEASAKDAQRASYCEARFKQDCEIMMNSPSVLAAQINGIPIFVDSVKNGDDFNSNWQAQTPAQPRSCYAAGLNLLGFPNPDTAYSILVSVVQNQPVPVNSSDYIQVPRGDYDAIINEAQHLAMFKVGGAEFMATIPLHQQFVAQAAQYNSKLSAMGQFWSDMSGLSQKEAKRNVRMVAQ